MPTSALRAFASLYRELTKSGIPPPVAKTMEVWEAAVALGVGWEDDEQTGQRAPGDISASDRALLQQRLAASKGEAEEPEAKATNEASVNAMMGAFQMPTG